MGEKKTITLAALIEVIERIQALELERIQANVLIHNYSRGKGGRG